MSADEAAALPGGRLAITLFWLGGATVLAPALLAAFELGAPGFLGGLAVDALLIPAWGMIALALALMMRRSKSALMNTIAVIWLVLPGGIIALAQSGLLDLHLEQT